MASLTAFIGSPGVAGYGATKAFNLVLAESLERELASSGVDALVCCAGVIAEKGAERKKGARPARLLSPPKSDPKMVAESALRGLGRRTVVVPGVLNRIVAFTLQHLLPRSLAVRLMEWTARGLDFPDSRSV